MFYVTWGSINRFVGQGLKINYEHCQGSSLRTFSTDVLLNQMELLECLFPSETGNGGSQRGIQYTEVWELLRHIFCTAVSSGWFMTASQADSWSLFFLSNPAPDIWHLRQWWCATYHVPAPSLQTGWAERSPGNERYRFNRNTNSLHVTNTVTLIVRPLLSQSFWSFSCRVARVVSALCPERPRSRWIWALCTVNWISVLWTGSTRCFNPKS